MMPILLATVAAQVAPVSTEPVVTIGERMGRPVTATFATVADRGFLRIGLDGRPAGIVEIETTDNAVALLADGRFAPLWPAITTWAGADLTRLRDARLARARLVYESGVTETAGNMTQSTASAGVRRVLQYAEVLRSSGRIDTARTLIESARAAVTRTSTTGRADYMALTVRLAGNASSDGAPRRAIAILDEGQQGLAPTDPFAINFDVNRAAYLAEAGDHGAALTMIDRASKAFDAARGGGGTRVKGSDRQFGWIRACALAGLGRDAEARRALAPVLRDIEPSQSGFVLAPTDDIQMRAFVCMGDAAAAAAIFARQFAQLALTVPALTLLQPGLRMPRSPVAFRQRIAAEPVLAPWLAARLRPLPAALLPALNHWRAPGD